MCRIVTIRYVTPDGRQRSTERKQLCHRSDGTNPCKHKEYSEVTELVSSGTPSLVHDDDIPSPRSASIPGTPITATANYEYRAPFPETGESSSKGKGRREFGLYLDLSNKRTKDSSPSSKKRGRRSNHSYSGSSSGDAESIVAIEEDGVIEPVSPSRTKRNSFGSRLSMRHARQPAVVSQPSPPPMQPSMRSPLRTTRQDRRSLGIAPDTVRFEVATDTEVMDRANAREQLRRENAERMRRQDAASMKTVQETNERMAAAKKIEVEETAKDEFSRLQYERLQDRDRRRQERAQAARVLEQEEKASQAEIEKIEKEIKDMKARDAQQKREKEEVERARAARQEEKLLRDEEARIEFRLQQDLDRINHESREINRTQLQDVQSQIDELESELAKQRQCREARERAEQLQREIRHASVLEDEILELETEHRERDDLLRLERQLRDLQMDRQRYYSPPLSPSLPRYTHSPTYPTANHSPRASAHIVQRYNPYQDPGYMRSFGEQVLQQERDRATARVQAASSGLQGMIAAPPLPPLRRVGNSSTISGTGSSRDLRYREQIYRDVGRRYPD